MSFWWWLLAIPLLIFVWAASRAQQSGKSCCIYCGAAPEKHHEPGCRMVGGEW